MKARLNERKQFLERWKAEKFLYQKWGEYLISEVESSLAPAVSPMSVHSFLRMPVIPRLKDDSGLIEKAFFRRKAYSDPYEEITDKVGIRFVVLLGTDIKLVEDSIRALKNIKISKDRDFHEEQIEKPQEFDYAAVHYIIRPCSPFDYEGVQIPSNISCEIQVKTILQHAYSELTHDTIYKQQLAATPHMKRNAAKAMALLEVTDDFFEKVSAELQKALSGVKETTRQLMKIYKDIIHLPSHPTALEGLLLEAYASEIKKRNFDDIKKCIKKKPYLVKCIEDNLSLANPIFSQPSVLLVYYAIMKSPERAKEAWPLTSSEMEPLLNALGESMDNND